MTTLTAEAEVMLRVAQVLDALPDDETRLRVLAQVAIHCQLYRLAEHLCDLAAQTAWLAEQTQADGRDWRHHPKALGLEP